MIDDDMRMDALKQTNYVKSLVTANGLVDLERKGKQSYQGYVYARLLGFSNGNLQALYDRSDGESSLSVREAYAIYRFWCEENAMTPLSSRSFSDYLMTNMGALGLKFDYHCINAAGHRVRGYKGLAADLGEAYFRPFIRALPDTKKCGV